jgi:hypothetical protein
MTKAAGHDAYIAAAPAPFRAVLANLRAKLAQALPDAEEVMKYDMPGFEIAGKTVAGYAAFAKQCGPIPRSGRHCRTCRRDCSDEAQGHQNRCHLLGKQADPRRTGRELALASHRALGL